MNIIICVTALNDGAEHFVNVDNIVYFKANDDAQGTRIYFTNGEISHLVARESPVQIVAQINAEIEKVRCICN